MVFESCPTMTFKQRVIALVVCCCLGYALEICGTLTLIGGPSAKNIRKFSVLYVLGNLIAIMATAFWVGPKFMCKKMFKSSRRCATRADRAAFLATFEGGRRRGRDVDGPRTGRGDAAAAAWIFRGRVAATPRLWRGERF